MADAEKKDPAPQSLWATLGEILLIMIAIYVLYRIVANIGDILGNFGMRFSRESFIRRFFADPSLRNLRRMTETSGTAQVFYLIYIWFRGFIYLLTAGLAIFIGWLVIQIRRMDAESQRALMMPSPSQTAEDPSVKRWKRIVEYSQSQNSADWRLAILEADIILDEILDANSYRGETIGDKLKQIEPSDMDTLNDAWEAHKIRNAIAHQGESFVLTSREARRVIQLYENVFREYEFI